jgi:mannan endo-1,4-beta-mannosidase
MIDAPDCGTNSDAFITSNLAKDLIQFDPLHNLIFSAHAYWYAFANNDSAQMAAKINAVLAQNIPLVLGEVANLQDDVTPCEYTLNYKPLLHYCQLKKVNWIAWSWDNDVCPARQVSSNGNFSTLTTYGNDIVNNPSYGLLTVNSPKSQFLLYGCSTGINTLNPVVDFVLYPNPATNEITINAARTIMGSGYTIIDQTGKTILLGKLVNETTVINVDRLTVGTYLFRVSYGSQQLFEILK